MAISIVNKNSPYLCPNCMSPHQEFSWECGWEIGIATIICKDCGIKMVRVDIAKPYGQPNPNSHVVDKNDVLTKGNKHSRWVHEPPKPEPEPEKQIPDEPKEDRWDSI